MVISRGTPEETDSLGVIRHDFTLQSGVLYDPTFSTSFANHSFTWLVLLTLDVIRPLKGFAEGINRLALGLVAKNHEIDAGIRRSIVMIPDDRPVDTYRDDSTIKVVESKPQYFS